MLFAHEYGAIRVLLAVLTSVVAGIRIDEAAAESVVMEFTSLPTTQGWTYENVQNSATELQVFSLNNAMLHQDSTIRNPQFSGGDENIYSYEGSNVLDGPFSIKVRVRVTSYAYDVSQNGFPITDINPFGFAFGIQGPMGEAYIAVTTNLVATQTFDHDGQVQPGFVVVSTGDNTSFHDYELDGVMMPGGSFSYYRDGVFLGSSPLRTQGTSVFGHVRLTIGDFSGGAVAIADIASYSAQSGLPVIKISQGIRLDFLNLITGVSYQLQSSSKLTDWTDSGNPFVAVSSTNSQPINIASSNLFFRLKVLP